LHETNNEEKVSKQNKEERDEKMWKEDEK